MLFPDGSFNGFETIIEIDEGYQLIVALHVVHFMMPDIDVMFRVYHLVEDGESVEAFCDFTFEIDDLCELSLMPDEIYQAYEIMMLTEEPLPEWLGNLIDEGFIIPGLEGYAYEPDLPF